MAPVDTSAATLNRLLEKLDHTVLSSSSDPRLRTSQYERNRVGVNIEHARTLLLTQEKAAATIRAQGQRETTQADLLAKRELMKKLNARLQELNQADEEPESDDDSDDEDVLGQYAPAIKHTSAGLDTGEPQGKRIDAQQANEIRSRKPLSATDNREGASTSAREQLFSGKSKEPVAQNETEQTELLMSHNRSEQENLTSGLLSLASALKASSLQFSSSLEAEKDVLKRAEGGLDKSAQGMEAAEKKMSMLRRMSEGQGWYGRIKLYGFIAALWVACFLLVFVGPKLRF